MATNRRRDYLVGLVRELCNLPYETEWVEFKVNHRKPQTIGEYVSALSNAAALLDKAHGYIVWGIENETHDVVGTEFSPAVARKGSEPLETWLLQLTKPRIDFCFYEVTIDEKRVVIMEIDRAYRQPVAFSGVEFIRIGSTKRKLKDYQEKERALWRVFDRVSFEDGIAAERVSKDEVLSLLDYPSYFDLLELPLPDGREAILNALEKDRLIVRSEAGGFDVTNLGTILFARDLGEFPTLKRKAMRVIQYRGKGKIETLREQEGVRGYAVGFKGIVDYIMALVPSNEVMQQALRRSVPMFPDLAIRELVANALIHQDFLVTGAGPMVEIFDDRIEITNPGEPLVDTQRFLDTPPRSRNETLASLMRRVRICEERGSGIDKVVTEIESYHLPAPLFEVPPGSTRAILFAHKTLADMDGEERVRACYLHACLKYVMRDFLTNASLRERFGIKQNNKAVASRRIREAMDAGMIKPFDENASRRMMKYVPYWA
ncbi:MAG: putative DNA binding domain-containing protein [Gemmatimonadota bacterium]|nr:putative DNA binding domain-containing protein [Gemmatimonadota bacterium]